MADPDVYKDPEEPGHVFYVARPSSRGCIVASVHVALGMWAAYSGESADWRHTRQRGRKLSRKEAADYFPDLDKRYFYRRL